MDDIIINGKRYISSKRAAEVMGYTQDYVGQLCRAGKMRAERISGVWYISEDECTGGNELVPVPVSSQVTDEEANQINVKKKERTLMLDGREYISSKRVAEIMGYTQDYVGQLCRGGKIEARQVGRGWYVPLSVVLKTSDEKNQEDLLEDISMDKPPVISVKTVEGGLAEREKRTVLSEIPAMYLSDSTPLIPIPKRLRSPVLHHILDDEPHYSYTPIPIRHVPVHTIHISPSYQKSRRRENSFTSQYDAHSRSSRKPLSALKVGSLSVCILALSLLLNIVPHTVVFQGEYRETHTANVSSPFSGDTPTPENALAVSKTTFVEKIFTALIAIFEEEIEYKAK